MSRLARFIPLFLNTIIPVIGILFFHWSIGDLFFLFFAELVFLGGITILQILFAGGTSNTGSKAGSFFRFILLYPTLFLFILIAAGNFFNGAGAEMKFTLAEGVIYLLIGNYILNFIFGFVFSGRFKKITPKQCEKETYLHMLSIFAVMLILLLFFRAFVTGEYVNFVLGVSIILAKNLVDYFLTFRKIS